MQYRNSRWVFHVMGACILIIASLLTYMSYQTWNEFSELSKIEETSERLMRGSENLGRFKVLTIMMLSLCVVLLLLVFWVAETHSGSGKLLQLSRVVDGLNDGTWDRRIKTNSKGALAMLEQSLENLRENLQSRETELEKSVTVYRENASTMQSMNQYLIKMATAGTTEELFRYFGDTLALLRPSHKYYLLLCDVTTETISSEPFITQHTNRELFFKKCGPVLLRAITEIKSPFLWKQFITDFTPQSDRDLSDLDYLSKIEEAFSPRLIFQIPVTPYRRYLLATDLEDKSEDDEITTFIGQLISIFEMKMNQTGTLSKQSSGEAAHTLNLHEFLASARTAIRAAQTRKHPVVFFMIGIDFFGTILEIYGEHTTQQLLKQLSELLHVNSRDTDIFGKFTDEIFLLMSTVPDRKGIIDAAEFYRKIIEDHSFFYSGDEVRITVSVGCANIRHEFKENEEVLLKRTRSMLEKAVRSGGNVSCFEGQLVERH